MLRRLPIHRFFDAFKFAFGHGIPRDVKIDHARLRGWDVALALVIFADLHAQGIIIIHNHRQVVRGQGRKLLGQRRDALSLHAGGEG